MTDWRTFATTQNIWFIFFSSQFIIWTCFWEVLFRFFLPFSVFLQHLLFYNCLHVINFRLTDTKRSWSFSVSLTYCQGMAWLAGWLSESHLYFDVHHTVGVVWWRLVRCCLTLMQNQSTTVNVVWSCIKMSHSRQDINHLHNCG